MHNYEVRPRKDKRGVDLISDALPFGRLWYGEPNAISNAIDYAEHFSRSHDAVIRVYDAVGNLIETHEHTGHSERREQHPTPGQKNLCAGYNKRLKSRHALTFKHTTA